MRRLLDRATVWLARTLAAVFYRSVEVRGQGHVPAGGPVLFVANHGNSLVDPLLLIARLPRTLRFLAKSTLWKNPAVRPLLALSGAVPVFRRQDGGDMSQNDQTFSRCWQELRAGGSVALFPEGISYHASELQPLKTGAARIALGAETPALRIVPVGLTFEDKATFRSRALVVVGEPIAPADGEDARALTDRIEAGLRAVTLNFESFDVQRLVERAAEVYTGEDRLLPGERDLAEHFSLRRAFGEGYAQAKQKHPERVEAIQRMAHHYDGMLEASGLRDDQLTAKYPWSHAAAYMGDRLGLLLAALPVAAIGTLLNYVPYRLPGVVGFFVRNHVDLPATYKILTGLVVMPASWALLAWLAADAWGRNAGITMAVLAPATGWFALLFHERHASLWREIGAWLTLRLRPERAERLRSLRAEIRREIDALVAEQAD
ncbi:MAG: lysophospholipid acyltransferase family protein [Myxococcota bacterium]